MLTTGNGKLAGPFSLHSLLLNEYISRRNRTTQSCFNCHATKRMCDRKRPCSRCTQLGLTGLCVYEVDDPARQSDAQDESSRLLSRIAELESVVRELKNKPHPRWAADTDSPLHFSPGAPVSSPPYVDTNLSPFGDMAWSELLDWDSSSLDSSYSQSPTSTPSPLLVPASRPPGPFPCHDSAWNQTILPLPRKSDATCSCMSEAASYNITLELASDLRRAARSMKDCFGTPCILRMKICELESFTMDALRNRRARDVPASEVYRPLAGLGNAARPGEQQTMLLKRDPFWTKMDETGLPAYDDSFMSWRGATAVQKRR
ncbi:hypothetical protein B0H17DRAFT_89839 [Mycena rosella]|uniref:Zn(2)-C6 fungal-type domain-containing protein n=1 Tax=Mycena rosella TaxID=1033263 RepID=A0AAD7GQE6_MYCRO|nr:hypothetical protein B0H17DRAFT_89839 [Mycena rosella]